MRCRLRAISCSTEETRRRTFRQEVKQLLRHLYREVLTHRVWHFKDVFFYKALTTFDIWHHFHVLKHSQYMLKVMGHLPSK